MILVVFVRFGVGFSCGFSRFLMMDSIIWWFWKWMLFYLGLLVVLLMWVFEV